MDDRIFIDNLRVKCRIGITAEERSEAQEVLVDVSLYHSTRAAGISDKLGDTFDYWAATTRISQFAAEREFSLLESLAEGLALMLLSEFPLVKVAVRVRKAKFSSEPSIGVEIEREKA